MKKKLFWLTAFLLLSMLLFTGSALGNPHGIFDGQPIIKLFVDGEELETDVPAINLSGRTMVPLRFIGEELGATFEYDADEYAVYMELPEPPEAELENDEKRVIVEQQLEDDYRDWEIGGRIMTFNIGLDDNYRGNNDIYVSFQIEREDYINWRDIRRLYRGELEDKITSITNYLENEYPDSGINLIFVHQTYYDTYDELADAVDLKEISVNDEGRFVMEETLASGFSWPDAQQAKIKIE